ILVRKLTACVTVAVSLVPPSPTAGAAGPWRAPESWRRRLICVRRFACARQRLASDYHFTLDQIAFDDFSCSAISEPNFDSPSLRRAILAKHPHNARLTGEHGRGRWRELDIAAVSGFRSSISYAIAARL